MKKDNIVNVFEVYGNEGLGALKKQLNEMSDKERYLIQKKYFNKIIKVGKEKQIENILKEMESYLNIGYVFSGKPYIKLL